jgi:hypothetical protein
LKAATIAACVATASLAFTPPAFALHGGFGGGGFHGGGFHGGGFGGGGFHGGWRGGGWNGGGWGGPGWGWGGVAFAPGWGWGGPYGWDDGYYGCSLRRVAVRTPYGLRWRVVRYC